MAKRTTKAVSMAREDLSAIVVRKRRQLLEQRIWTVFKESKYSRATLTTMLEHPPEWFVTAPLESLVRFADVGRVDPRWLALGESGRAASAAIVKLRKHGFFDAAATLITMIEPDFGPGICRYCGCTDEMGCGDCRWLDDAATICSACLEHHD